MYTLLFFSDRICPVGMVKCSDNLQCIYEVDLCNGHARCRDKSDESPELCTRGMLFYIST